MKTRKKASKKAKPERRRITLVGVPHQLNPHAGMITGARGEERFVCAAWWSIMGLDRLMPTYGTYRITVTATKVSK